MTRCDCPVCARVEAYIAAPAITRRPTHRDRITHAHHLIRPADQRPTPPLKEPAVKHVFDSSRPAGYDPSVCREYQGRGLGYCGRPATAGLCTTHAEQRNRAQENA